MSGTGKTNRILSVDILRGMTICGMILVNNPGTWSSIYAPLDHAEWNGITPTDLVFPFFMFIMGFSTFLSLRKYGFEPSRATFAKILKRTVGIYLVGLFIGWFSHFCYYWGSADQPTFLANLASAAWNVPVMRLTGVLARLAICYGLASVIIVGLGQKYIPHLIVLILAGYTILLFVGNGFSYGPDNILSIVDHAVLGSNHLYNDNGIDPEGLLSTLPSLAHVLLGFYIAKLLFRPELSNNLTQQMVFLFVVGALLTFAGFLLSYGCPLNKKIWSPTFVLVTCGLASTLLALLIYVVDAKGCRRWSLFFESFGVNPLFIFVVSDILAILLGSVSLTIGDESHSLRNWFYTSLLQPAFGSYGGSLAYALLFVVLNWGIAYQLYRRKIFIKL